jgi:hypothetical protein
MCSDFEEALRVPASCISFLLPVAVQEKLGSELQGLDGNASVPRTDDK